MAITLRELLEIPNSLDDEFLEEANRKSIKARFERGELPSRGNVLMYKILSGNSTFELPADTDDWTIADSLGNDPKHQLMPIDFLYSDLN